MRFEISQGELNVQVEKSKAHSFWSDSAAADAEIRRRAGRLLRLFQERSCVGEDEEQERGEPKKIEGKEGEEEESDGKPKCPKLMLEDTDLSTIQMLSFVM